MPYERKSRRYKKRRPQRRRRRNRSGTISTLSTNSQPFPASYLCKHRYVETFTLDPTFGTPSHAIYSCNGLFDPTTAVGGHQPLGFDQMTQLYDHYTVLGAKATIRFFSGDDATSGSNMCYAYVNDDSTPITTYDTVMEQNKGVVKPLTSANAAQTCTIVQKFSAKKFFGVTDIKDNSQLKGSSGANPVDGAFFIIGAQGIASSIDPTTVYCNITIDYITLWSERHDLAQS